MRERRTIYHHEGYRLRSYTELLWARALDAAEIFYLYEPDLVAIQGGCYLPDFYLPHVGSYIEVKGKQPTQEEIRKADEVMDRTGREVFFLIGQPQSDAEGLYNCGLMTRGANGWNSNISPNSLHRVVKAHAKKGVALWTDIHLAVQEDDLDWVRHVSEIMEEMFLTRADRSDMERVLREVNGEASRLRLAAMPPPSECERGLKWFLDRQEFRKSQRGAA